MITITAIDFSDLEQLALLYEELTGTKSNTVLMERQFLKMSNHADYILIGAKDEEEHLMGSVMGIICEDLVGECQPFIVIENMIVSAKYRKCGVGRQLIEYIENYARTRNCYYSMLVSLIKRKEAHAFYQSIGYGPEVVRGFKKYL